jgi:adenylylsulfate kinase-like enzyme
MARSLFHREEFFEVFINTPLEICEQRDPKGLYKKARRGELKNFTGIDSAFQPPEQPELSFDTSKIDVKKTIDNMIDFLNKKGL